MTRSGPGARDIRNRRCACSKDVYKCRTTVTALADRAVSEIIRPLRDRRPHARTLPFRNSARVSGWRHQLTRPLPSAPGSGRRDAARAHRRSRSRGSATGEATRVAGAHLVLGLMDNPVLRPMQMLVRRLTICRSADLPRAANHQLGPDRVDVGTNIGAARRLQRLARPY